MTWISKFLLTIKLFIETYKVESYLGDLCVINLYEVRRICSPGFLRAVYIPKRFIADVGLGQHLVLPPGTYLEVHE